MNSGYAALFLISISTIALGQNLVPNGSFEELHHLPVKDNPRNGYEFEPRSGNIPFTANLNYWVNATNTTPDLRITDPDRSKDCIRQHLVCDEARTGLNSAGIITYMRNDQTSTYREYIQVELREKLKPGKLTHVEFWAKSEREAKLVSNNLGVHFSMKKITDQTLEVLRVEPQINFTSLINPDGREWSRIRMEFSPEKPYQYLILGNFFSNENTLVADSPGFRANPRIHPYAYYLIDDVRVWQDTYPEAESVSVIAKSFSLKNLQFDYDEAIIRTSAYEDLDSICLILRNNPAYQLKIYGHTDQRGSEDYNLSLSQARADAVLSYLAEKGVAPERMTALGLGKSRLLNTAESEQAFQDNRRVEFVLQKE